MSINDVTNEGELTAEGRVKVDEWPATPGALHYLPRAKIIEGQLTGVPQRAICGMYFVPRPASSGERGAGRVCDLCRVLYEGRYAVELRGSNR